MVQEPVLLKIRSGLTVTVWPLRMEDVDSLLDLFAHMGPDSRYNRFQLVLTNPDEAFVDREARRLADVPSERGRAWLLRTDLPDESQAVVGGMRYLFEDNSRAAAEVSVVVRDDCQGQGIGTAALAYAAEMARLDGIRTLTGTVLSTNRAVFKILSRLPFPTRVDKDESETRIEIDLTRSKAPTGS